MAYHPKTLKPYTQDQVRDHIRAVDLINMLQNFALGEKKPRNFGLKLRAIEILLRKVLPDLEQTSVVGDDNNPIKVESVDVREIGRRIAFALAKAGSLPKDGQFTQIQSKIGLEQIPVEPESIETSAEVIDIQTAKPATDTVEQSS